MSGFQRNQFDEGYAGVTFITAAGGAKTGAWFRITTVTATVFSTLTGNITSNSDTMTGVSFPAGMTIYGDYTAITLTSGSILAYAF